MQTCLCHFAINLSDSFSYQLAEGSRGRRRKSDEAEFHNFFFCCCCFNPWQNDILFSMFYWLAAFSLSLSARLVLHKHMTAVFCLLLNGILNNFFRRSANATRTGIVDKASSSLFVWPRGMPWQSLDFTAAAQSSLWIQLWSGYFFSRKLFKTSSASKENRNRSKP